MKKILLLSVLSSLLVACATTNDPKVSPVVGLESYGKTNVHNFEAQKGKKTSISYFAEGKKDFSDAKIVEGNSNQIILNGETIDLTKAGKTKSGNYEVSLGSDLANGNPGYYKDINQKHKFLKVGTLKNLKTKHDLEFIVGDLTPTADIDAMADKKFTYNGTDLGNFGQKYTVDFANKKITSAPDKMNKFEATIYGNTFKSDKPLEYSYTYKADQDWQKAWEGEWKAKTTMTGAFYGKGASEMGGMTTKISTKVGSDKTTSMVGVFTAKKGDEIK